MGWVIQINRITDGGIIKVSPIEETFDVNDVTFRIHTRETSGLFGEWIKFEDCINTNSNLRITVPHDTALSFFGTPHW